MGSSGLRSGFGTQFYSNGEKFMGTFVEDKAQGQGTFHSLGKAIMGEWEGDKLREVYL